MKLQKKIIKISILSFFFMVFAIQATSPALASFTQELWNNSDVSGEVTHNPTAVVCVVIKFRCVDTVKDIGQIHVLYMGERIDNDDPNADYWAIYIVLTVNPNEDDFWLETAKTTINLPGDHSVVHALPDRSGGYIETESHIGYEASNSGGTVKFSLTRTEIYPDVVITPDTNFNKGGSHEWLATMHGDAQKEQNTFYFTVLLKQSEGGFSDADIDFSIRFDEKGSYTDHIVTFPIDIYMAGSAGGGSNCGSTSKPIYMVC